MLHPYGLRTRECASDLPLVHSCLCLRYNTLQSLLDFALCYTEFDCLSCNKFNYFFLNARAGGILRILQSDWLWEGGILALVARAFVMTLNLHFLTPNPFT